MRMCVQYAVDYPERAPSQSKRLDLISLGSLTFAEPDSEAFPLLGLASRAISLGGAMPAVMNAADEVAVSAFLEGKIGFTDISDTVISAFERLSDYKDTRELDGILAADKEAREITEKLIKFGGK